MKIRLVSDLHLEFLRDEGIEDAIKALVIKTLPELPEDLETVLVVAGDLCNTYKRERFKMFFDLVSPRFKVIFYVAGNHEYYGGTLDFTRKFLFDLCFSYKNVEFFNTFGVHFYGGKRFVADTLWTDFDKEDPTTMFLAPRIMNDYRHIYSEENIPVTVEEILAIHNDTRKMFDEYVTKDTVVITHHLPSFQSVDPAFKGDPSNAYYASNLEEFILDRKPKLWLHGHTHHPQDYKIGDTRIVCNPRGYKGQEKNGYNPTLVIEV